MHSPPAPYTAMDASHLHTDIFTCTTSIYTSHITRTPGTCCTAASLAFLHAMTSATLHPPCTAAALDGVHPTAHRSCLALLSPHLTPCPCPAQPAAVCSTTGSSAVARALALRAWPAQMPPGATAGMASAPRSTSGTGSACQAAPGAEPHPLPPLPLLQHPLHSLSPSLSPSLAPVSA
jgi:hypothetical protein